ncbi:MAG TPA: hypothetical protein VGZ25_02575 [Gemmataceae bacterium]|jgi:hypothetical protein|nr:hypothetical protein [Gemmataceae bacterium]
MGQTTLEKRVLDLEKKVAELAEALQRVAPAKDWRRTLGMFTDDEVMKRIDEQVRKIRENDRKVHGAPPRARKAKV